jgi:hypothetical protein
MYKVLLLNDDFTPMEFVVHVLERLFNMTHAQAIEIMLTVHRKGVAVVGVFLARDRRNQGGAGDGTCPPSAASAAMHHGKRVEIGWIKAGTGLRRNAARGRTL